MTCLPALKIGVIVPGFSADASDWCIPVLVDVMSELSCRAEVHLFALRYPPERSQYQVHGVWVHALGGGTVRGAKRAGLLAAACASIMAEHRRGPFTVLHGIWADEPGFVAVAMARLLRVPVLVSVMGGELLSMPDIGYGGHLSAFNRLLSALTLRGATLVTAASDQPGGPVRRLLPHSRQSCLIRLVWGINPALFQPDGPSLDLAGEARVLHVGSLVAIKDHTTLLRAIARLRATSPDIHLHLVGDGPLRADLAGQVSCLGLAAHVTFHGHVDRGDLSAYYRAAHVVTVSSRYEAQSAVALEAARCGVPVVGTEVGLVGDFAPRAATAVPVGDDRGLARAIQGALQPEIGGPIRVAAGRLVAAEGLAVQTAERLMSIYRNPTLIGRAR